MIEDRRTKAQLSEELEKLSRENAELRRKVPAAPVAVPEADALAGCIRALDALKETRRNSYTTAFGSSGSGGAVARTILALCEKYDVPRFEKVVEECGRRHVEDMSAVDVLAAVKRDFEGMSL